MTQQAQAPTPDAHHHHRARRPARRGNGHDSRLALQPARIRQTPFPDFSRRHRRHPGRRLAEGTSGSLRRAEGSDAGIERHRHRKNSGRTARARRLRNAHQRNRSRAARSGIRAVSDSAQRARRRFSARPAPSLDSHAAPGLHSAHSRRSRFAPRAITWMRQGYTLTDAPIFTPAACEGTTTLFEVNYIDDQKAYLTQSGQLYVEATAAALGKVYTFGPTFRAEKSKTRRHLTEFWMLEPEAAYAHLEDMMRLGEGLVSAIVQSRREESRARTCRRSNATSRNSQKSRRHFRASATTKPSRSCKRPATPRNGATISAATKKRSSRKNSTSP